MINCPWDKDDQGQKVVQDWVVEYLSNKDVPLDYLKKPKDPVDEQVRAVVSSLLGPRNFILLLSENISYVWSLYYYIVATWTVTTGKGFYILDVQELDLYYANEILPKIQDTSLLVIPYTDPQGYDLRKKRNILGNILAKRKARKQPFLTDFYFKRMPASKREIAENLQPISNIFGDQSFSAFLSEQSTTKLIKIKEK